jgi:anti-sigma B factor antagonist
MFESAPSDDRAVAPRATPLCIEGPMTFARALELRDAVLDAVNQESSPIEFDLSDVTELDSAGVQLLLLAKRTAAARGMKLELVGQSAAVLRTLELLHLAGHFGGPAFGLFDEDGL